MEIIQYLDYSRLSLCNYFNCKHMDEYFHGNYNFDNELDLLKEKLLNQPLEIMDEIDCTFVAMVNFGSLDSVFEMIEDLTYQL